MCIKSGKMFNVLVFCLTKWFVHSQSLKLDSIHLFIVKIRKKYSTLRRNVQPDITFPNQWWLCLITHKNCVEHKFRTKLFLTLTKYPHLR